jgi:protein ImuA
MPRALSLATPYVRFAPPQSNPVESGLRRESQIHQAAGDGEAFRRAISFGLEALDRHLKGGGLPFGAHQIAGSPGDGASAMLFALLAAGRRLSADPRAQVLVVQERAALAEGGDLYGQGLHALGLDVARIAFLGARDGAQALRMTDEAIRSGAAAVVVAELHRAGPRIDLSATRRFNLFGRQTDTLALLVTPDLEGTSAAMTRWRVRAAPSQAARRFVGPPALDLELTRNRLGPVGRFTVEWSSENAQFRGQAASPIRAPVVPAPFHRPGEGGVFAHGDGPDAKERVAAYRG